jgi:phosphotriesterase-related protein
MTVETVETVTGPVPVDRLGVTLWHEHVVVLSVGLRSAYPQTFPRSHVVSTCIEQLTALRESGVQTVVDHTPYDLGRDVELLAEVSAASGLQIVCCTGAWVAPQRWFHVRDPVEAAQLFVADLADGIGGTGIRAGIIKCAIDTAGLTGPVERVLRAAAIAHRETGAPISTHTHAAGRTGLLQQRVFVEEGVDPNRVVIGHSGDTEDLDYLDELLAAGSYLGMDRFGVEDVLPDDRRMDVVATLCARGRADRLLLSHDANCWNDRQTRQQLAALRPNWHHRHVLDSVVPGLRARGVREDQLHTMLVDNPRAVFTGHKPVTCEGR